MNSIEVVKGRCIIMEINKAIGILVDYQNRIISSDVSDALNTLIMSYYDLRRENKMLGGTKDARRC